MGLVETLHLASYAAGALGGALLFVETFQLPSYVEYDTDFGSYSVQLNPQEASEYTWVGRIGFLLVALAFAGLFVATFL
ncbi:hypothetical protein [Salarchaeum sp. JOR-1]|uniref:hypothetical protein n=1 Tax=Salarchaeum sp. JOR-1 TaxID=2599399 RepID=UPI00119891E8|nr:hypothetical protein [Salarchaeum sp. JOR-1]QDX41313.1 hypothetical protein FQU85_10545 [Salarchaeum sp. JOR-1]